MTEEQHDRAEENDQTQREEVVTDQLRGVLVKVQGDHA